MIRLALPVVLILTAFAISKADAADLPDNKLTPGVARNVDVNTLCHSSTKLVRLTTTAMKLAVYKEYGIKPRHAPECTGTGHSCYEIDHRIALEDGGADDIKNLWPQSYDGTWNAHVKDLYENFLHRKICNGKITIQKAQKELADDWIKGYKSHSELPLPAVH